MEERKVNVEERLNEENSNLYQEEDMDPMSAIVNTPRRRSWLMQQLIDSYTRRTARQWQSRLIKGHIKSYRNPK